jgi:hypothetical protein
MDIFHHVNSLKIYDLKFKSLPYPPNQRKAVLLLSVFLTVNLWWEFLLNSSLRQICALTNFYCRKIFKSKNKDFYIIYQENHFDSKLLPYREKDISIARTLYTKEKKKLIWTHLAFLITIPNATFQQSQLPLEFPRARPSAFHSLTLSYFFWLRFNGRFDRANFSHRSSERKRNTPFVLLSDPQIFCLKR